MEEDTITAIASHQKRISEVELNECDIKNCHNPWTHRVCILDMCDFHYEVWVLNGGQKK